jgi:hypothetical protein
MASNGSSSPPAEKKHTGEPSLDVYFNGPSLPKAGSYRDPIPPLYTCRLVPRVYIEPHQMFDDVDMVQEYKKVYGPDIIRAPQWSL